MGCHVVTQALRNPRGAIAPGDQVPVETAVAHGTACNRSRGNAALRGVEFDLLGKLVLHVGSIGENYPRWQAGIFVSYSAPTSRARFRP